MTFPFESTTTATFPDTLAVHDGRAADPTTAAIGVTDGLVRLSVGIEGEADLIEDLSRTLAPLAAEEVVA